MPSDTRLTTIRHAQDSIRKEGAKLEQRLAERAASGEVAAQKEYSIGLATLQLWNDGLGLMKDELALFIEERKKIRGGAKSTSSRSILKNIKDVSECVKAARDCAALLAGLVKEEKEEKVVTERDALLISIADKLDGIPAATLKAAVMKRPTSTTWVPKTPAARRKHGLEDPLEDD